MSEKRISNANSSFSLLSSYFFSLFRGFVFPPFLSSLCFVPANPWMKDTMNKALYFLKFIRFPLQDLEVMNSYHKVRCFLTPFLQAHLGFSIIYFLIMVFDCWCSHLGLYNFRHIGRQWLSVNDKVSLRVYDFVCFLLVLFRVLIYYSIFFFYFLLTDAYFFLIFYNILLHCAWLYSSKNNTMVWC